MLNYCISLGNVNVYIFLFIILLSIHGNIIIFFTVITISRNQWMGKIRLTLLSNFFLNFTRSQLCAVTLADYFILEFSTWDLFIY